jgi:uncharacterized delta-60 repeat protein
MAMSKPPGPSRAIGKVAWMALATVLLVLLTAVPAAAQARPGSLDQGFGVRGKITRTVNPGSGSPLHALKIALTPGGGIFVLAGQNLLRYRSDGRLDPSFGNKGKVIVGKSEGSLFEPTALAVDSRGRALVAGTTTLSSQSEHGPESAISLSPESATVYRFTPNGQPDPSFGVGGAASSTFGLQPPIYTSLSSGAVFRYEAPEVQVSGLTVDSKDRPVLTGTADTELGGCRDLFYGSVPFRESFLARLTASGDADPTFNGTGVRADIRQSSAEEPIVDPSGGVLYRRWVGSKCEQDISDTIGVGRLDADGIPDPAFGSDEPGQFRPARAIAVNPPGGILLLLNGENEFPDAGVIEGAPRPDRVVRLHPNGALDKRFGRGGTQILKQAEGLYVNAIAADSQGRVVVSGRQRGGESVVLFRLHSNGQADRRFGRNGKVITRFASEVALEPPIIIIDRHDHVLVGGWVNRRETRFAIVRYMP